MHERGEVGVAGADRERGDEAALVGELDGVDGHLDVGRVLPRAPELLRDLDQLDLGAGEQPAVLVEVRPVRVRPPRHHPPALGQRVGDRAEVERGHAEAVARPDREVLVVEEQRDALVVVDHTGLMGAG